MEFKYVVIVVLALIVFSLGKALFHLSSSKPGDDGSMVKALGWRVGLSVFLFALLFFAHSRGWLNPPHT
jgi:hypothetical protein